MVIYAMLQSLQWLQLIMAWNTAGNVRHLHWWHFFSTLQFPCPSKYVVLDASGYCVAYLAIFQYDITMATIDNSASMTTLIQIQHVQRACTHRLVDKTRDKILLRRSRVVYSGEVADACYIDLTARWTTSVPTNWYRRYKYRLGSQTRM